MQVMEYKITYGEGETERVTVEARTINSGYSKALKIARQPLGNGTEREIARVEFWEVISR